MKQIDRAALLDWDKFKDDIARATPVDTSMSHAEREKHRLRLEQHPLEWIRFFFPNYAKYDFAPFQRRAIQRVLAHPEWFEVLSWSRELAKSTITMFCVLFLALTGRKRNVILTSNSKDNAVRLLAPYRANLEANGRIQAYYGKQPVPGSWTEDEFITRGGVAFRALGAGQSPRGSRNEAVRPDVLLVDDFDTDDDTRNPDIIQKRWEWWENALYPTRSVSEPTLIVFCGNIIAKVSDSGVPVVCCGEVMSQIIPGTTDAAVEKHVPVWTVENGIVHVKVGSVEHPMLPEHYIEWVSLHTKQGNQRKELHPGEKPEVCFALCEGDEVEAVYAYCNLHSLWKA